MALVNIVYLRKCSEENSYGPFEVTCNYTAFFVGYAGCLLHWVSEGVAGASAKESSLVEG